MLVVKNINITYYPLFTTLQGSFSNCLTLNQVDTKSTKNDS